MTNYCNIAKKLQIVKIMLMKFEVLACVRIKITVFYDGMVLSSLVHGCQHFGKIWCSHLKSFGEAAGSSRTLVVMFQTAGVTWQRAPIGTREGRCWTGPVVCVVFTVMSYAGNQVP